MVKDKTMCIKGNMIALSTWLHYQYDRIINLNDSVKGNMIALSAFNRIA
jgi:hypothetical protein